MLVSASCVGQSLTHERLVLDEQMELVIAAERTGSRRSVLKEIVECVKQGLTLQKIETFLRGKRCFTYLIAHQPNLDYKDNITVGLDAKNLKVYILGVVLAETKESAMREIDKEWPSYETNFQKLKETGFVLETHRSKIVKEPFRGLGDIELTCFCLKESPSSERAAVQDVEASASQQLCRRSME